MAWLDVRYVPQYLHLGCSGAMYKSANIPFHKIYFLDNENIVLKTYIFTYAHGYFEIYSLSSECEVICITEI